MLYKVVTFITCVKHITCMAHDSDNASHVLSASTYIYHMSVSKNMSAPKHPSSATSPTASDTPPHETTSHAGGDNTLQWGGRFAGGSAAIMQEINASISFDQRLYAQDIRASVAHVTMLAQQGILTQDEATEITQGLHEIAQEFAAGHITLTPALEDIHTHVESRLREKIGVLAGKLHTARSRNDQVATDFRLWLRDAIDDLAQGIHQLCHALLNVASPHTETLMAGLTHMQVAQPVSFAQHLMAYAHMFRRDYERLLDCRKRVNLSPLGAAALAGTAFPIDRHATAEALGFSEPMANSMDSVSARDFVLEFLGVAAIHSVHLSRLAEEIVLWSSSHIGYIQLSDAYSTGSSIMPQKRNPDAAELVRAKPGRIIGHLTGLLTIIKALPLTYAKDLQEDKEPVFDTVDTLALCLAAITGMIQDITVNTTAMRDTLYAGFPTATDLADWLVREKGITFREAHHFSGAIVRMAEAKGVDIANLSLAEMQTIAPMLDQGVFDILTPEASLRSRNSFGGVAPKAVAQQIRDFRQQFLGQ